METLGIHQPIVVAAPALPAPKAEAPIAAPLGGANVPEVKAEEVPVTFDAKTAEDRRIAAIRRAAQQVANTYVVSDKTFSLFKDTTGQYITRFTSLRDGRVTYIPEPELFKMSGGSASEMPLLNIST